jgi:hypothetical protein
MEDMEALKAENAALKNALDALAMQLANAKAEIAQLKKDVVEAAKPQPKVTPKTIALTKENIEKLSAGLRGHLHRNAVRKKYVTVAAQLLLMHNQGEATGHQLRQASGLSFQGFSVQSLSLRKLGLMLHPRYKKYTLSDKSKQILNTVFGE